jgi:predicted RNA-binding Zn-ribbon protein involved in translation (DUF1610 family)
MAILSRQCTKCSKPFKTSNIHRFHCPACFLELFPHWAKTTKRAVCMECGTNMVTLSMIGYFCPAHMLLAGEMRRAN